MTKRMKHVMKNLAATIMQQAATDGGWGGGLKVHSLLGSSWGTNSKNI